MIAGAAVVELSEAGILEAWVAGAGADSLERPLLLLDRAGAGAPDVMWGWTVGRRDARLIELCEKTFGSLAEGTTPCPGCETPVEISFPLSEIQSDHGDAGASFEVGFDDGRRIRFRLPTSADLRRAWQARSAEEGARLLAAGCVLDDAAADQALSDAMVEALGAAMAERDRQSDVRLEALCPVCGSTLTLVFDIADYVWKKVAMAGRQLVAEVHQLASAYGWSEAEVLAVPAARRQRYLELT